MHGGEEGGLFLVDAGDDVSGDGKERLLQLLGVERLRAPFAHDARGEQGRAGVSGRVVGGAALETQGDGDEGLVAGRKGEELDAFDLLLPGPALLRRGGGRGTAADRWTAVRRW